MLTIRCAKCKSKLFKYQKIGFGKVLKCFKDRINHTNYQLDGFRMICSCGNMIAIDKETYFQMKQGQFTCSGTKDPI